jgi:hypothetical protein
MVDLEEWLNLCLGCLMMRWGGVEFAAVIIFSGILLQRCDFLKVRRIM